MVLPISISWSRTKKNVEEIITKYVYYILSVDNNSTHSIKNDFLLENIDFKITEKSYSKVNPSELKKRIDFVNYFRMSYNRLTSDERKIIYWTYIDKENNYDDRFIANNLGFSLGYYYIKKKEAIIRFAYSLGVEEKDDWNSKKTISKVSYIC